MTHVTITRLSNFILLGRTFKIKIDGEIVTTIANKETKTISLPENSSEMTVKIMQYESRPMKIDNIHSNNYSIKMKKLTNLFSYGLMLTAPPYLITSFVDEGKNQLFIFLLLPFLLGNIYYMTIGRRDVIQILKN